MKKVTIAGTEFVWGSRTYLMGVINVTPDSFSGDGLMRQNDWILRAVEHGKEQEKEGADILDVGGESTRPGSTPLSLQEELDRVIPVIERLSKEVHVPISIDTYKSEVAMHALDAGASIINDVWALSRDSKMASVAAQYKAPLILMHNRSRPQNATQQDDLGGRYIGIEYKDIIEDIKRELLESVEKAQRAGIAQENIILDPGIGFGKTVEHNLELLDRFREFTDLGFPLLSGPSRKSFVGFTLNVPPAERLEGTAAAVALSIDRGADIVRVHDVKEMYRVAKFTDAVVRRSR